MGIDLVGVDFVRIDLVGDPIHTHTHTHSHIIKIHPLFSTDTLAVQTEALQVLSALCKFYFPSSLSHCWSLLKDLYLSHLTSASLPLQQHILKMLEELLRALSSVVAVENADSTVLSSACAFWEELLGGELATYLQGLSEHSSLTSQACNVLSTMGVTVMTALKVFQYYVRTTLTTFTDFVIRRMVKVVINRYGVHMGIL